MATRLAPLRATAAGWARNSSRAMSAGGQRTGATGPHTTACCGWFEGEPSLSQELDARPGGTGQNASVNQTLARLLGTDLIAGTQLDPETLLQRTMEIRTHQAVPYGHQGAKRLSAAKHTLLASAQGCWEGWVGQRGLSSSRPTRILACFSSHFCLIWPVSVVLPGCVISWALCNNRRTPGDWSAWWTRFHASPSCRKLLRLLKLPIQLVASLLPFRSE